MAPKQLPQLPEDSELYRQHRENWDDGASMVSSPRQQIDSGPPIFSRYPLSKAPSPPIMPTPRRPSASSSTTTPLETPSDEFSSRGKAFWRKLSTPPSTSLTTPSPRAQSIRSFTSTTPMDDATSDSAKGAQLASPGGLGKKRSSGQLLADLGRGLSRVGSVMKRTPPSESAKSAPTRQGSKLGLSKQGSIRRQMQQGTWRGRKVDEGPEALEEEEEEQWQDMRRNIDVGDEGIGRPFNVAHDLHITSDLDNLPPEWASALKAQGMTEAELLIIAAARKRQAGVVNKPLHVRTGSARRTSQRRKASQSSSPIGPSPTDTRLLTTSPSSTRPKHRLPALTHLDDFRPSLDFHPFPSSAGPSRASSLHPSPTLSVPPSAFTTPKRNTSSKRLSDQLRGFANLNLDGVGSWAEDVLELVSPVKPDAAKSPLHPAPHMPSPPARSPRSPRVTVPEPTSDASRGPTLGPAAAAQSPRSKHHESPRSHAPQHRPPTPYTPFAHPPMSHSHSQSLSTAEDQEIRTPSSSESEDLRAQLPATSYPAPSQRWRSAESMVWTSSEPTKVSGKHPIHELSSPISIPSRSALAPIPSASSCSDTDRIPQSPTDYDLSIPSPLRPPPRPHFSLPASARGDADDDLYDPLELPEPGSPILRPSEMPPVGRSRYPHAHSEEDHAMEPMRESGLDSRKPSDGSIIMIHPYSNVKEGSKGEATLSRPVSEIGRRGPTSNGVLPVIPSSPMMKPPRARASSPPLDDETDRLSPLPPSLTNVPTSSPPSALHYLDRQSSSRSHRSFPAGRESMADSTFSGESVYRDSVLGAKVMTAQMGVLGGRQEMGRMSVFDLGDYMTEEEGDEEVGEVGPRCAPRPVSKF